MKFIKLLALHAAGSIYEAAIGQSHTQRLVRRKVGNVVRRFKGQPPLRSWEDSRAVRLKRLASVPTAAECERLNREAARSI